MIFTAFDPVQGTKAELAKVPTGPEATSWDLSPDRTRVALSVFDDKAGDLQTVPLNGGTLQKLSAMPWTELVAIAWAADGMSLFPASHFSRGTSIAHLTFSGEPKLLFKQPGRDSFLARAVYPTAIPWPPAP